MAVSQEVLAKLRKTVGDADGISEKEFEQIKPLVAEEAAKQTAALQAQIDELKSDHDQIVGALTDGTLTAEGTTKAIGELLEVTLVNAPVAYEQRSGMVRGHRVNRVPRPNHFNMGCEYEWNRKLRPCINLV
jgi:hypothetical protein